MIDETRRGIAEVLKGTEGRDRDGRYVIELTVRTQWFGISVIGTPKPPPPGRAGEMFAREFLRVLGVQRPDQLVGSPITVLVGPRAADGRLAVIGVAGVGGQLRFDDFLPRR
jgi:hypothetical protein